MRKKEFKVQNNYMRFKNKVCIVTGGSSGIGKATSLQFALEGGKVAILSRSEEEGNNTVAEIVKAGGTALFIPTDVSVQGDIETACKKILAAWHRIDIVVNNAAMMTYKPIKDLSVDEWDNSMAVNLRAVFLLTQFSLRHIKKGAIVNVSSVHAHETTPGVVPYAASKSAIESFTRGVSMEYDSTQVRINCVAPGAVDTPMLWDNPRVKSGAEKVAGKIGQPEDIAAAILFLASDDAKFINGTTLIVDGGRLNKL